MLSSAVLFVGIPTTWKLLPCPKVTVAVCLEESSCATVTKSLKEAIAGPTFVMSTIETY